MTTLAQPPPRAKASPSPLDASRITSHVEGRLEGLATFAGFIARGETRIVYLVYRALRDARKVEALAERLRAETGWDVIAAYAHSVAARQIDAIFGDLDDAGEEVRP